MADPYAEAERLFAEGEALADEERDAEALARFEAAWAALPEPKGGREPAVRILAAVAGTPPRPRTAVACPTPTTPTGRCPARRPRTGLR
jgi:hypothetical protein